MSDDEQFIDNIIKKSY